MPARINGKLTKEYRRKMYWAHRDKVRAYKKQYEHSEANQRARRNYWETLSQEKYNKIVDANKKRYRTTRDELIMALGGKCSNPNCLVPNGCQDRRCLQIDHINGGGRKLRATENLNSYIIMRKYINNMDEAKKKIQLLCANCNWIKRAERKEEAPGPKRKHLGRPTYDKTTN